MKRLPWISLASALALFAGAPSPALGTPDRSTPESARWTGAVRLGWPMPRSLGGAERYGRGKRCVTCRWPSASLSRAAGNAGLAVPEPAGALLFGLGALAIRVRAGRRRR